MPAQTITAPVTDCTRCGRSVPRDETSTVDGDEWCESCTVHSTVSCTHCHRTTRSEDARETVEHYHICQTCRERFYSRCTSCDLYTVYLDDDDYCPNCSDSDGDDEQTDSSLVHSYNYKPTPVFHGSGRMFGVELEVEVRSPSSVTSAARTVLNQLGDAVYLKHDGSLTRGFECVTHPHSLAQHRLLWEKFKVPDGVRSYSTGNCGLHVHADRRDIAQIHLGKILVFVNAAENQSLVTLVAQRSNSDYARISPKHIEDARPERYCYEGRYTAVNLLNRSTAEFRIFRGNTRPDRVLKAVCFAASVIEFTRDAPVDGLTADAFTHYLTGHRRTYPELYHYLRSKDWIKSGSRPERDE